MTTLERLPILFVDLAKTDKDRIKRLLQEAKCDCTDSIADQLYRCIRTLPVSDGELFGHLLDHFRTDWDAADETPEECLRRLKAEYEAADDKQKIIVERTILAATNGLYEHPEWWDMSCLCDECRSCG